MSRLLKFCLTKFGGLDIEISDNRVKEIQFRTRIRPDELEDMANFLCPAMMADEAVQRPCIRVDNGEGGLCPARAVMRAARREKLNAQAVPVQGI